MKFKMKEEYNWFLDFMLKCLALDIEILIGMSIEKVDFWILFGFWKNFSNIPPLWSHRRRSLGSINICLLVFYYSNSNIFFSLCVIWEIVSKKPKATSLAPSLSPPQNKAKICSDLGNFGTIELYTPQYLYAQFPLSVNFNGVETWAHPESY